MRAFKGLLPAVRTALVSDALDLVGLRCQSLGTDIRPLNRAAITIGRVLPVRVEPSRAEVSVPYKGLLATLDAIRPGNVVVIATGRSEAAAVWGELCQTACQAAGGLGAATDGVIRDTHS